MKSFISVLALGLTATFAMPAAASTITVDTLNQGTAHDRVFANEDGGDKWRIVTRFEVDGVNQSAVYAGLFRLKSDQSGPLSEFLAFCLQPLETLTLPKDHHVGSTFGGGITDNLNILAANAFSLVNDSVSAAAFQMAAWELTTETNSSFDVDDGFFAITSGSTNSNAAEMMAQGWLDQINDGLWTDNGQSYVILNATGTQDLLTDVAAVPLPASGMLLLGGLFGAGMVARRKARKS